MPDLGPEIRGVVVAVEVGLTEARDQNLQARPVVGQLRIVVGDTTSRLPCCAERVLERVPVTVPIAMPVQLVPRPPWPLFTK